MPRVAVVGHVEWVTFARVPRLPRPGDIVHADEVWDEAAGGGSVAAVGLTRLAGRCAFLTALGADEAGSRSSERLSALGVSVFAGSRASTRRAFTHTDDAGERTITVLGERIVPSLSDPLPWDDLASCDAVYFTGGDAEAVAAARAARVLVATPRASEALIAAGVLVDALVFSGGDPDEVRWAAEVAAAGVPTGCSVVTAGAAGGRWSMGNGSSGTWAAAPVPGPVIDAYGCGDSFAAGLTLALGREVPVPDAVAFAARCGALCLTGRGPYGADLGSLA